MPTSTHDIFTELIVQEVGSQLKTVTCGNTDIAAVIDSVRSESTSDVYLYGHEPIDERYPKYTPDASFARADSQYPSIVIETSYSQQYKDLVKLAAEYICGSDGNIGVVLGLDIEYGVGSKRASISIWRPGFAPYPQNKGVILKTVGVQEADPFRADDGTTVQGRGLSLQLCDFVPRTGFANVPPDTQSMTVIQIT
ncbi:hypothetical protein N7G274_004390 [Stereocaulon virgatum]|uniref:Uncharacterized protein n=1 Tax=Stereocaulon virgatum TaxID=373712 RepID=A0ABR4ACP8_9LECA